MSDAGLRLKREKCCFMKAEVIYLGHKIDAEGLHPTDQKISDIINAPEPRNVSELKAYLGMINYYSKYIGNISTKLAPLYLLLRKSSAWSWGKEQQQAFANSKTLLTSETVLAHFDPDREIILACDASPYGVGAVISHVNQDGSEQPIAFASRTLSPAEKNYSQLDKEGLAIIFGVKRFHQYLYGRLFTIESDHKPLLNIFGEHQSVPRMASARLQRWALTLSGYCYQIKYKAGSTLSNADGLSRLPAGLPPEVIPVPGSVLMVMEHFTKTVVNLKDIKRLTARDTTMSKVLEFVKNGWPNNKLSKEQFRAYYNRREELSIEDGCILWGTRVVIPPSVRRYVLDELHEAHPGISRIKALSRCYVWWPGIDADLESIVQQCPSCQQIRKAPPQAPLHPWEWPNEPWDRIHVDYAGPFESKMFLIIVDAHSKWIDVHITTSSTSRITIEKMRKSFADHGIPRTVVTCFSSDEFSDFMKSNGIKHIFVSPYRPASNGLAERAVQTVKEGLRKIKHGTLETRLSKFLLAYRITPQSTTGQSPSELIHRKKMRSRLDLLKPNIGARVMDRQSCQKYYHTTNVKNDQKARPRQFVIGDTVLVKNFSAHGEKWLPGRIIEERGPVSFTVELSDGRVVRRHVDHIHASNVVMDPEIREDQIVMSEERSLVDDQNITSQDLADDVTPKDIHLSDSVVTDTVDKPSETEDPNCKKSGDYQKGPEFVPRRSTRQVKPPDKLNLYIKDVFDILMS